MSQQEQRFPTNQGYMTAVIQRKYIEFAIAQQLLPKEAYRMADIITLEAPANMSKPIQIWQLYSVLGQQRIMAIVERFYRKVFNDEHWFKSVFERVGPLEHHVKTQSQMWVDVMGGGLAYHGGEFRLNFHHTHNAMQLMNERGAARWVELMVQTLDESQVEFSVDSRARRSVNTFLSYFMDKYAEDFKFDNIYLFGETNPAYKRTINFLNMTSEAIEALSEDDLKDALDARGVDVAALATKQDLVNKALSL